MGAKKFDAGGRLNPILLPMLSRALQQAEPFGWFKHGRNKKRGYFVMFCLGSIRVCLSFLCFSRVCLGSVLGCYSGFATRVV